MEKSRPVAPHSLALVLSQVRGEDEGDSPLVSSPSPPAPAAAVLPVKAQHHSGYEVFANFKSVNMQLFWNKALTRALSEIFFLGWIDERVLLIQGEEVHLQVLRNGWTRRTLIPPRGFDIQCIGALKLRCYVHSTDVQVAQHVLSRESLFPTLCVIWTRGLSPLFACSVHTKPRCRRIRK